MAKRLKDDKWLIIAGSGNDFASIGMGVYVEFVGRFIICDNCNIDCGQDTVYYIPVLNRIFCKECFGEWVKSATYYPEDADYEKRYFEDVKGALEDAGLWEDDPS